MLIKVIGPGCRNSVKLERVTREAVENLGVDAEIEKVTDDATIAGLGVLSTPGLVVDGEVVLHGRVPSVAQVRDILEPFVVR